MKKMQVSNIRLIDNDKNVVKTFDTVGGGKDYCKATYQGCSFRSYAGSFVIVDKKTKKEQGKLRWQTYVQDIYGRYRNFN